MVSLLEQWQDYELDGRYRLQGLIGEGGYGAVFKAEQTAIHRPCAIKVLLPELCVDARYVERFKVEAMAMSRLVHPNSVMLYDFGEVKSEGIFYLVMEYLEGENLDQYIKIHGNMSLKMVVHLIRQVCGSLNEAHSHGLIHRDIKPQNLMKINRHGDPSFMKVIDFGIAKLAAEFSPQQYELTEAGTILGTPHYMSPEQILNEPLDGRSDQYSLATCIYKMLSGQAVFQGTSPYAIASKHLTHRPTPLSVEFPDLRIPQGVDDVLQRALSKKSHHRFDTISEFSDALIDAAQCDNSVDVDQDDSFPRAMESVYQTRDVVGLPAAGRLVDDNDYGERVVGEAYNLGITNFKSEPTKILIDSGIECAAGNRRESLLLRENRARLVPTVLIITLISVGITSLIQSRVGNSRETIEESILTEEADNDGLDESRERLYETESAEFWATSIQHVATSMATRISGSNTIARTQLRRSPSNDVISGSIEAFSDTRPPEKQVMTGMLSVSLIPWGTLWVGNKEYGEQVFQEIRLPVGKHELSLRQNGQIRARKSVDVMAGSSTIIELVAQ